MAELRLSPRHLAAPRKLILLVRIAVDGTYEAVTLMGDVALTGRSREEIKEKVRVQVRQMHSSVRPTTVRLHFVADQRTWLHAPLPEGDGSTDTSSNHRDTNDDASHSSPSQETSDTSKKSKARKN